jgi:hypothetical protein
MLDQFLMNLSRFGQGLVSKVLKYKLFNLALVNLTGCGFDLIFLNLLIVK